MCRFKLDELLKDERVIDEIQRHRWFESEKQGEDIGFTRAANDWYKRFATEWLKYHALQGAAK